MYAIRRKSNMGAAAPKPPLAIHPAASYVVASCAATGCAYSSFFHKLTDCRQGKSEPKFATYALALAWDQFDGGISRRRCRKKLLIQMKL